MDGQLKGYVLSEAIISAAFNLFINGMVAALIYHMAETVATDPVSSAIDLLITCVSMGILTALFSRASVKRTKVVGIFEAPSGVMRFLSRLFCRPVFFGLVVGMVVAVVVYIPTVLILALPGILAIPFGIYVTLKCLFAAVLGGGIVALELYAGMCKVEGRNKE